MNGIGEILTWKILDIGQTLDTGGILKFTCSICNYNVELYEINIYKNTETE